MRIISNTQVLELLQTLTPSSLAQYQQVLTEALQQYHCDPTLIPNRIVINKPTISDAVHIYMPSFTTQSTGIKTLAGSKEGFKGGVVIIDKDNGEIKGVINAMSLTGFRTALASSLALVKFFEVERFNQVLSVYGNGEQAYWHVKLTLSLYETNFSKVQIVVREINTKSEDLAKRLGLEFKHVEIVLVESSSNFDLSTSSVIYGCIPSTTPSILLEQLSKTEQVFISLIGSYKPHMFEADDAIIQKALSSGKVIVDSYEHTLAEAGELIKNNVTSANCVELGELQTTKKEDIVDFNKSNLVLAKIVGLSIMDVSVGGFVLSQAIEKNIGIETEF